VIPFDKIETSTHIVLEATPKSLANASALYTYILRLHKKVSLVCYDEVDKRYRALPWYEKIRSTLPTSADLIFKVPSKSLYSDFVQHEIQCNVKMATAFLCGLIEESRSVYPHSHDGTYFAQLAQLCALGADYESCVKSLYYQESLSKFRLKGILFQKMLLQENGTSVVINFDGKDLVASGATMQELDEILYEFFHLVHVKKVILKDQNKVLKLLKDK